MNTSVHTFRFLLFETFLAGAGAVFLAFTLPLSSSLFMSFHYRLFNSQLLSWDVYAGFRFAILLSFLFLFLRQVRRQRLAEQELTLKECQQQTEQLQIWLANIAQTLDHVTRIRDPSQLQVIRDYEIGYTAGSVRDKAPNTCHCSQVLYLLDRVRRETTSHGLQSTLHLQYSDLPNNSFKEWVS